MIRHIVLFTLPADRSRDDPDVTATYDALSALGDKIDEVRSWQVGWKVNPRATSDFALVSEFDDLAALRRYVEHPEHQAVVAMLDQISTRTSVDLEA